MLCVVQGSGLKRETLITCGSPRYRLKMKSYVHEDALYTCRSEFRISQVKKMHTGWACFLGFGSVGLFHGPRPINTFGLLK